MDMAQDKAQQAGNPTGSKPAPRVKLTAIALYKLKGGAHAGPMAEPKPVAGCADVRRAEDGKIELLFESVPLNSKAFDHYRIPAGAGVLMMYGVHDTTSETKRWFNYAREHGANVVSVDVQVNAGRIEKNLMSVEMLQAQKDEIEFLAVARMKSDLQLHVFEKYFKKYAKKDDAVAMERPADMAKRPDFFARLLEDMPELHNLKTLVIPVADLEGGVVRHLALVRPGSDLEINKPTGGEVFCLPAWMTDLAMAKQMRKSKHW
jgi:hypothetical protein